MACPDSPRSEGPHPDDVQVPQKDDPDADGMPESESPYGFPADIDANNAQNNGTKGPPAPKSEASQQPDPVTTKKSGFAGDEPTEKPDNKGGCCCNIIYFLKSKQKDAWSFNFL
jgi:hypothetical protein